MVEFCYTCVLNIRVHSWGGSLFCKKSTSGLWQNQEQKDPSRNSSTHIGILLSHHANREYAFDTKYHI